MSDDPEEMPYQPQNNHGISQEAYEEMQAEMAMPKCHGCHIRYDENYMTELNNHQYCENCKGDAEMEIENDLVYLVMKASEVEKDYLIEMLNYQGAEGVEKIAEVFRKALKGELH